MKELTKTEIKVAHGISQGFLYKELADKLCVSTHTIHAHLRNIRIKVGARNIADITRLYILSLDNPKLVLKALFFLVLQVGIMVGEFNEDFRKPSNKLARVNRVKSKIKTGICYV